MGEGRVQGCVWPWVAVPRPPLPAQRVRWDSQGPGSFSSYFAVPLVALKHLLVLSGDWLEPHPNPEIPGGVGCQKWLNSKSRVTILLGLLSAGLKRCHVPAHTSVERDSSPSSSGLKGRQAQMSSLLLFLQSTSPPPHPTKPFLTLLSCAHH